MDFHELTLRAWDHSEEELKTTNAEKKRMRARVNERTALVLEMTREEGRKELSNLKIQGEIDLLRARQGKFI